jgi:phospholipid/cholesterol/gamma-HCH transport system substrate-binding protein
METRANYVIVGIFTLVAILSAFGFVYWAARFGQAGDTLPLRIRIPGSASGLGRGSAVLFNGVKVGDLKRIFIDPKNPNMAIADSEVDRTTPITQSTVADVGIAGLTGQANIELRGGNPDEKNLLTEAEANNTVAVIQANPSAVTNLLETAQEIFKRTDTVLNGIEGFVRDARGPLTDTVRNTDKFSKALADNSDQIDDFLANVGELSTTLKGVSGKLGGTLDSAKNLIDSVDKDKVAKIVGNVQTFTDRLDSASKNLDQIMANVDTAVASLKTVSQNASGTLHQVDDAMSKINGVLDAVDPQSVKTSIANIEQASRTANTTLDSAKSLIDSVDRDKLAKIVADVQTFTDRLNSASRNLDQVMANVDATVTSFRTFSQDASGTLHKVDGAISKVDGVLDAVDPQSVKTSIANIEQASRTASTAIADVSRVTTKLGNHADDVDQIVHNTRELMQRLNAASVRVDGVLAKIDSLLGSDQANGLVRQASDTLKSFKEVADTLNAHLGTITAGIARFSGEGLKNVDALVLESRRAVTRIEEAVDSLANNPQRILTGGEGTVRQYDGRLRR